MSNADAIYWNSGAENIDSILHVETVKNAATVLGYRCDKIILTCLGGKQEYWFNQKALPVNPVLYVHHKLANWYAIISITHALPLKYTLDNPQFTLTSTATAIKPMTLNDSFFTLPSGVPTMKSAD